MQGFNFPSLERIIVDVHCSGLFVIWFTAYVNRSSGPEKINDQNSLFCTSVVCSCKSLNSPTIRYVNMYLFKIKILDLLYYWSYQLKDESFIYYFSFASSGKFHKIYLFLFLIY